MDRPTLFTAKHNNLNDPAILGLYPNIDITRYIALIVQPQVSLVMNSLVDKLLSRASDDLLLEISVLILVVA